MVKFIPYEKLSKREKRAIDRKSRTTWTRSPITRKPADPRVYDRGKTRNQPYDDGGCSGPFYA